MARTPKKSSRRKSKKYPALEKKVNLKTRQDLVDYDYLNKLSPAEMQWLNDFTEEYTHANFKHDGKILHKDKKLRKSCFGRNNARNRDTYSLKKSVGDIVSLDELKNIKNGYEIDVDAIIDKIDGEYED